MGLNERLCGQMGVKRMPGTWRGKGRRRGVGKTMGLERRGKGG